MFSRICAYINYFETKDIHKYITKLLIGVQTYIQIVFVRYHFLPNTHINKHIVKQQNNLPHIYTFEGSKPFRQ